MRIFAFPLFLNLCYVLSSPAVRRADLSTPTSIPQPSSTTPSDSDWFWWSNGQNTTYGGYYPEWDQCPKEGTTCEEACGLGAVECGTLGNNCYFPGLGDQCCYQWGG
ncbi:hypothetical protein BU16DRAFT_309957 [Lophium mytilinum]|uniref:Uncharacterized protein n=1 Tax=Lophium mytilinum TaxID=390894 RepID=A0A6A6R2G2_9PEZI|nr:hypothetical protein BU16DRAFT_309957 [Lophium mytilinum]